METDKQLLIKTHATVHRFMNGKEKWIAFVVEKDEMPFEIISCMAKNELEKIPPSTK